MFPPQRRELWFRKPTGRASAPADHLAPLEVPPPCAVITNQLVGILQNNTDLYLGTEEAGYFRPPPWRKSHAIHS